MFAACKFDHPFNHELQLAFKIHQNLRNYVKLLGNCKFALLFSLICESRACIVPLFTSISPISLANCFPLMY